MVKLTALRIATCALLLASSAKAETVYTFAVLCNAEKLSHCFSRIETRLARLNGSPNRRICLPMSFGGLMSDAIPVSLLEHVRIRLSAARFGNAASAADDVIVRIVNRVYACDVASRR